MRNTLFIIILLMLGKLSFSQELIFGWSLGTNVIYQNVYKEATFQSPNSYFVYHEAGQGQGVLKEKGTFCSAFFGPTFTYAKKRLTFNLEPQYAMQRLIYEFEYEYPIERIIGKRSFRLPFYGTYKLFKSAQSFYFILGFTFNVDKNYDIQSAGQGTFFGGEVPFKDVPNYGNNHLYGLVYDEHPYFNSILGFGKPIGPVNLTFRASTLADFTKHEVLSKSWQLEMHLALKLLSSKDFTKKHFLYVE